MSWYYLLNLSLLLVIQAHLASCAYHDHLQGTHTIQQRRSERDSSSADSSEELGKAHGNTRMIYPSEEYVTGYRSSGNKMKADKCPFGVCEEVDNYPAKRIKELIERSDSLKAYFANQPKMPNVDISTRFGKVEDTLCSTVQQYRLPRKARNTKNEELLIINVDDYQQFVSLVTCESEEGQCKYSELFPNNVRTQCKQKYSPRLLMALHSDKNETIYDTFSLPSCCVCTFVKVK